MDPIIGWFQPEQDGPARELWSRIWEEASKRMDNMNLNQMIESRDFIPIDMREEEDKRVLVTRPQNNNNFYNPTRRKQNDNRASTYGMNENMIHLIGRYGGCPWRDLRKEPYSKGVVG